MMFQLSIFTILTRVTFYLILDTTNIEMSKATDEVLVWLTENHKNFVPSAKDIKNTDAESSVYAFLTHHLKQKLVLLCKDGRVHFKATGQDTVCKLDQLVNYSKSRSYQRALRKATQKVVDIAKYAPYIVPHSQFPEKVFCIVTRDTLHLDEDEIERHINGYVLCFAWLFFVLFSSFFDLTFPLRLYFSWFSPSVETTILNFVFVMKEIAKRS